MESILLIRRWPISERYKLISNLLFPSATLVHVYESCQLSLTTRGRLGFSRDTKTSSFMFHRVQMQHYAGEQSSLQCLSEWPSKHRGLWYAVISHSLWDLQRRGQQQGTLHVTVVVVQQHEASYGSQKLQETLQIQSVLLCSLGDS